MAFKISNQSRARTALRLSSDHRVALVQDFDAIKTGELRRNELIAHTIYKAFNLPRDERAERRLATMIQRIWRESPFRPTRMRARLQEASLLEAWLQTTLDEINQSTGAGETK